MDFPWAAAEGVDFFWAAAEGVDFVWAAAEGVDFLWATVEGVDFFGAAAEIFSPPPLPLPGLLGCGSCRGLNQGKPAQGLFLQCLPH